MLFELFPIAHRTTVTSDMQLKLEGIPGRVRVTREIPPSYAWVTVPGHLPIVVEGKFGIMISQCRYMPEYTACVEYYDFKEPSVVSMEVKAPCTVFCYTIENEPVILRRLGPMIEQIVMKRHTIPQLEFARAGSDSTMIFEKGQYSFLHFTVTVQHEHILENENWIMERIMEYENLQYHDQ